VTYHNTTHSTGETLRKYEQVSNNQEDVILSWFQYNVRGTASQAHECMQSSPITSTRRAMTNLANAGKLVKTQRQVEGPYGRPEYIYELAGDAKQQSLFD
jgi:predicted ArsR family transcriptional regulator